MNNVVERTMSLTIVSTMFFSIDKATTVVHGCNGTGENNIHRILFAIVIIVGQPTVLTV